MDDADTGDQELLRLAHLLRLCGDLARSIARRRADDSAEIDDLAQCTLDVACRLSRLVVDSHGVAAKATEAPDRRH